MGMGAIAICVKTPGHSALKTRLAAQTGKAWAEHWYGLACAAVAEVACAAAQASGATVYWAVAEAAALAHDRWSGLSRLPQGEGGLGSRLQRVLNALVARHGAGVLLGADTPQLDVGDLQTALNWLQAEAPRQCLGPAADGGFWLYGSNRAIAAGVWDAIPWSTSATAQVFQQVQQGGGDWCCLPEQCDVDTLDALSACHAALTRLARTGPAQRALHDWMAKHPPPTGMAA